MTPLSDIVSITIDSTFEDAETVLADTGFSKLPVCDGSADNIVGVIFLHDLFSNPISLKTIMKKPMFISEKRAASSALEKLKQHTSSIAFITDTIGETVGMVTIEDLVEELFGDFEDIFDEAGKNISRVQGGGLVVDSLVEIDDLKEFGYEIPEGNYETIGGFVISSLGRIPRAGESLNLGKFRAKVLLASPSRLRRIYLTKMPLKTLIPKQP
jgi:CBS domain containing-hemolysin-like protein